MNKPDIGKIALRVLTHLGALILCTSAAAAAVEISAKPTANMTCSAGVCSPTAKKAVLNVNDLAGMLASGDTTIKSTSQNPDIEIDAKIEWSSANRLMLDSFRSIGFNKAVEIDGPGSLTINTNDGGNGGDFRFFGSGRVHFRHQSGALTINAESYVLIQSLSQLALNIRRNGSGRYALSKSLNTRTHAYRGSPIKHGFGGIFEGLGNTISHLSIAMTGGLFPLLVEQGLIRDIGLPDVNISGGTDRKVGALVDDLQPGTMIENSYATGLVTAGSGSSIGGLVGLTEISGVQNSYANVAVSGDSGALAVGGLIGTTAEDCFPCAAAISQSYASGTVSGGDSTEVGGLIGENGGATVLSSYATGAVSGGNGASVGGLIGASLDRPQDEAIPAIRTSYSTGAVTGGTDASTGGLIGEDVADAKNTDDYWNLDTSGIGNPSQGAGNVANDAGITGLTDAQLKSGLPSGFDRKIWAQKASINSGYPYLIAYPPQ